MKVYELPANTIALTKEGVLVIMSQVTDGRKVTAFYRDLRYSAPHETSHQQYIHTTGIPRKAYFADSCDFWCRAEVVQSWPLELYEKKKD